MENTAVDQASYVGQERLLETWRMSNGVGWSAGRYFMWDVKNKTNTKVKKQEPFKEQVKVQQKEA